MSRTLTCANGHRWAATEGHGATNCPECGASNIEAMATASGEESLPWSAEGDELPPPPEAGRAAPRRSPRPEIPE
jgi:hypothetical protein